MIKIKIQNLKDAQQSLSVRKFRDGQLIETSVSLMPRCVQTVSAHHIFNLDDAAWLAARQLVVLSVEGSNPVAQPDVAPQEPTPVVQEPTATPAPAPVVFGAGGKSNKRDNTTEQESN